MNEDTPLTASNGIVQNTTDNLFVYNTINGCEFMAMYMEGTSLVLAQYYLSTNSALTQY